MSGNLEEQPDILGYPEGPCEKCREKQAEMRCCICGRGGFCSQNCRDAAIRDGPHVCGLSSINTADALLSHVMTNSVPSQGDVRTDYFFDQCNNRGDELMLLGLYNILIITCGVTTIQLDQWRLDYSMYKQIVRMLNRKKPQIPAIYRFWLLRSRYIFAQQEDEGDLLDPLEIEEVEELVL